MKDLFLKFDYLQATKLEDIKPLIREVIEGNSKDEAIELVEFAICGSHTNDVDPTCHMIDVLHGYFGFDFSNYTSWLFDCFAKAEYHECILKYLSPGDIIDELNGFNLDNILSKPLKDAILNINPEQHLSKTQIDDLVRYCGAHDCLSFLKDWFKIQGYKYTSRDFLLNYFFNN